MTTERPAFFKIGGSVFDEVAKPRGRHADAVHRAVENIRVFHRAHPEITVFVMPGNGPPGNVLSVWPDFEDWRTLSASAKGFLKSNAILLDGAFDGRGVYRDPADFDLSRVERGTINILPYAPAQARSGSPIVAESEVIDLDRIYKSDLQTLVTAVYVGARDVVFLKHTDAIYDSDPTVLRPFHRPYKIEEITAHDLLHDRTAMKIRGRWRERTVSRRGADGRGDHLCESIALRYMECVGPERIFITSWWDDWTRPDNPAKRVYVTHDPRGISRIVRAYADVRRAA